MSCLTFPIAGSNFGRVAKQGSRSPPSRRSHRDWLVNWSVIPDHPPLLKPVLQADEAKIHKPPQDDAVEVLPTVGEAHRNLSACRSKPNRLTSCLVASAAFEPLQEEPRCPPCFLMFKKEAADVFFCRNKGESGLSGKLIQTHSKTPRLHAKKGLYEFSCNLGEVPVLSARHLPLSHNIS